MGGFIFRQGKERSEKTCVWGEGEIKMDKGGLMDLVYGKEKKRRSMTRGRGGKDGVEAVPCHLSCCDLSGLTTHKALSISQLCSMPSLFYF